MHTWGAEAVLPEGMPELSALWFGEGRKLSAGRRQRKGTCFCISVFSYYLTLALLAIV